MKRILLLVAFIIAASTVCIGQDKEAISQKAIVIDVDRMANQLNLNAVQKKQVKEINEHFMNKQKECLAYKGKSRTAARKKVIMENLKLMKEVLTTEQNREYMMALNTFNSYYYMIENEVAPFTYFADVE